MAHACIERAGAARTQGDELEDTNRAEPEGAPPLRQQGARRTSVPGAARLRTAAWPRAAALRRCGGRAAPPCAPCAARQR